MAFGVEYRLRYLHLNLTQPKGHLYSAPVYVSLPKYCHAYTGKLRQTIHLTRFKIAEKGNKFSQISSFIFLSV